MGIWAGKNRDHKTIDPCLAIHPLDYTLVTLPFALVFEITTAKKRIADTSIAKSTPFYALTSDLIFV